MTCRPHFILCIAAVAFLVLQGSALAQQARVDVGVVELPGGDRGIGVRYVGDRVIGLAPGASAAFVADADTVLLRQIDGTHRMTVTCKRDTCAYIETAFYTVDPGGWEAIASASRLELLLLGLRGRARGVVPGDVRATIQRAIRTPTDRT